MYSWRKVKFVNEVFTIKDGQEVMCRKCGIHDLDEKANPKVYRKGEVFLAGAAHTPYNGKANFICKDHLDKDAVIVDSVTFSVVNRSPVPFSDVR